ncbi:hypothetical protein PAXRUDRAFT_821128 [Paxillus rubicundulus Ve08.2h10]|uniref:Uncharacterized protein n=1 Tax=Paxillus rubicundulus Ve08.2h10 TaxID=930991 RepID=A0A0D0DYP4_9AGAM|nr:hypothetical protein PAXRUDRAFT_821128 [Paxillus rubicundulus Ve08.2h10]
MPTLRYTPLSASYPVPIQKKPEMLQRFPGFFKATPTAYPHPANKTYARYLY